MSRLFHSSFGGFVVAYVIVIAPTAAQEVAPKNADTIFFQKQIEPILKQRCLGCHSHAAGEMEGGLTLDSRSGWLQGGERGPAIVPGKPEKSLLVAAIRRHDPQLRMPPDEPLAKREVELLVEWIRRGATDPRTKPSPLQTSAPTDWWSLRPLDRPAVPTSVAGGTPANTIDAFIRNRLHQQGQRPAPEADRRTLIRRLYFDLHGLPPDPAAVRAFVADRDPLAYEKLVDRLLNSPRYGERWARHWFDVIHFADSHGCEHDVFRPHAWRYRDYVIERLNADIPWSRFIREQLAVDHFFPQESNLLPALGFIAAGPLELSRAGTAPITFDYLDRDDIVTQTMAAFTSTTVNCARCHKHKFDPITQSDYYALQAVFAGGGKGDVTYDLDPTLAAERRRWTILRNAAKSRDPDVLLSPAYERTLASWIATNQKRVNAWKPLIPETYVSSNGTLLERLSDHSLLATGPRPDTDIYTITCTLPADKLTALRLDVLSDERLPKHGPGRCENGNLHLNQITAQLFRQDEAAAQPLSFRRATADWNQAGWTISHALDDDNKTAWGIFPKVGQSHSAVFELAEPQASTQGNRVVIQLKQIHGGGHLIGRLKLYASHMDGAETAILPDAIQAILATPAAQRSAEQKLSLAAHVLERHAEAQLAKLPGQQHVYAWSAHYSHAKRHDQPLEPKQVHVLQRGNIHKPQELAQPGALSVIATLPDRFQLSDPANEATRRAALADWLAAPHNPLTWRSIVNRVWLVHFGHGLCDTPNDFGRMGDVPSHPELLDWLAVWFRDDAGGSLKQLHRLILLSDTWRQASRTDTVSSATAASTSTGTDAVTRSLARMTSRPLDAESYRDAILQISGRIDFTMGGPGIQQFTQSKGRQDTPQLDYDAFDWSHPSAARRSIYRVVWRGIADPFMEALDFPDLGLLAPKRASSISALQALTLYNNDFVLYHSRLFAEQLGRESASLDDQLEQAVQRILLRDPHPHERKLLRAYANEHGLAATCRVLFNSNEFLFVE